MSHLSVELEEWLIENALRGISPALLAEGLKSEIPDGADAQAKVEQIIGSDLFKRCVPTGHRLAKLESILGLFRQLANDSNCSGIRRVPSITAGDFFNTYYRQNRPVIISDWIATWPALRMWSPSYFKTRYGSEIVQIEADRDRDPAYYVNQQDHFRSTTFFEFASWVESVAASNDRYMVANNKNLSLSGLADLLGDIQFPPCINADTAEGNVLLWFGPAGTVTPLHHDLINVLMAQVYGRKRIFLISPEHLPLLYNNRSVFSDIDCENPDLEQFPRFADVIVTRVDLAPGEVLFIPVGWWHQVRSLDVSITVTFRNFHAENTYPWRDAFMTAYS